MCVHLEPILKDVPKILTLCPPKFWSLCQLPHIWWVSRYRSQFTVEYFYNRPRVELGNFFFLPRTTLNGYPGPRTPHETFSRRYRFFYTDDSSRRPSTPLVCTPTWCFRPLCGCSVNDSWRHCLFCTCPFVCIICHSTRFLSHVSNFCHYKFLQNLQGPYPTIFLVGSFSQNFSKQKGWK